MICERGRPNALRDAIALVATAALLCSPAHASVCYGTVANGRLVEGVQLPVQGTNFLPYSQIGVQLGRTHVHSVVRDIVVDAYSRLEKAAPGKTFVYGETGLISGGRMRPHRTHQAGISVDFMVPVLDNANRSVRLPSTPSNKFGYGLDFDNRGRMLGLRIDFDSMAEHLYQLNLAAKQHNATIERVIFDRILLDELLKTRRGADLRRDVPFMKARPWIRHDEHYHVDFGVRCLPLNTNGQQSWRKRCPP